jgi:hypothetical protein
MPVPALSPDRLVLEFLRRNRWDEWRARGAETLFTALSAAAFAGFALWVIDPWWSRLLAPRFAVDAHCARNAAGSCDCSGAGLASTSAAPRTGAGATGRLAGGDADCSGHARTGASTGGRTQHRDYAGGNAGTAGLGEPAHRSGGSAGGFDCARRGDRRRHWRSAAGDQRQASRHLESTAARGRGCNCARHRGPGAARRGAGADRRAPAAQCTVGGRWPSCCSHRLHR